MPFLLGATPRLDLAGWTLRSEVNHDGDRAFGRHTRPDPERYEIRNVLASHPPSGHSVRVAKAIDGDPESLGVPLGKYSQLALLYGLEDWVSMREVAGFALNSGVSDLADQVDIALLVLRELLDESLVEVGEISEDGFAAWDLDAPYALARVREEISGEVTNGTGMDLWLRNTPQGDVLGQLARTTLDPTLWRWDQQ